MIKIYNAGNTMEAQYLCSLLEDAGISVYTQKAGAGDYMQVVSGMNDAIDIWGTDLFVNDGDASRAKQMVEDAIREKKLAREEEKAEEGQNDQIPKIPWYKNRTIIARILLAWAAIMGLIVGISSL